MEELFEEQPVQEEAETKSRKRERSLMDDVGDFLMGL